MWHRLYFLLRPSKRVLFQAVLAGFAVTVIATVTAINFSLVLDIQRNTSMDWRFYLKQPLNGELRRYDLISFNAHENVMFGNAPGALIGKMIVGLPGDSIEIKNELVYVNGVEIVGINPDFYHLFNKEVGSLDTHYELLSDQYFVLGTTPRSLDSRYWGPIKREWIDGRLLGLF